MEKDEKIFVAGHDGMIGLALVRELSQKGFTNLITQTSAELDLSNQKAVLNFFMEERPAYVFLAGTRIGGILANSKYPAEFIFNNLQSQTNIIHATWQSGVKKLLFLASSCVYPKDCPQPMKEEYLLSGKLEPTSEPYAIAKIAGIKMCQAYNRQYGTNFISAIPADLYGPDDDFNPETSHVLPALIRKTDEAKTSGKPRLVVWGTGLPRREAFHVDDLADACVFLMQEYNDSETINVGSGTDLSIKELALLISGIVGFEGDIAFDSSRPDGTPRKLLDISKIRKLGWAPEISPEQGIRQTHEWYVNHAEARLENRI